MSEPLRIAAVLEGPTDEIVLEAILRALLPRTDFVLQTRRCRSQRLRSQRRCSRRGSVAFGTTGGGWVGVYRWSRQAAREGDGSMSAAGDR